MHAKVLRTPPRFSIGLVVRKFTSIVAWVSLPTSTRSPVAVWQTVFGFFFLDKTLTCPLSKRRTGNNMVRAARVEPLLCPFLCLFCPSSLRRLFLCHPCPLPGTKRVELPVVVLLLEGKNTKTGRIRYFEGLSDLAANRNKRSS